MTISEQIKVLCVRSDISVAELARRIGTTPQNFNGKMKRESFTIAELEDIADAVNSSFERKFVLENGEKICEEKMEKLKKILNRIFIVGMLIIEMLFLCFPGLWD